MVAKAKYAYEYKYSYKYALVRIKPIGLWNYIFLTGNSK